MNEHLAKELVKSRKAVKQKYQSLKHAEIEAKSKLEAAYKPITQPLQELISSIGKTDSIGIKEEPFTKLFYETSSPQKKDIYKTSTPQKQPIRTGKTPVLNPETPSFFDSSIALTSQLPSLQETNVIAQTSSNSDSSHERTIANLSGILEQTRRTAQDYVDTPAYVEWLSYFHELPRTYIDDSVRDVENKFDHHYGIVHDIQSDKLTLGLTQEPVEIIAKDIKIKNITYPGTVGLYELLFKKHPMGYKKEDLDNYMDILSRTNAYRRNHLPDERVQGNSSYKYKSIIGPYLLKQGITKSHNPTLKRLAAHFSKPRPPYYKTPSKTGSGLTLKVNKQNTDYVYWDNVNELVDRLRLLVASMIAGNTGHNNEIISIIEELKEANIIV